MDFWQQLVMQHHRPVMYGIMIVAGIILYWPVKRLGAALLKVKWLNKEITWPGSRKAERPASAPVPPAPAYPPGPRGPGEVVYGVVGSYLKKQLFNLLLLLLLAPGFLCGFWLFEPPGFAAGFPAAFQVLCVFGLLFSIVVAAVLYLYFKDKLGLK
jgi:hypothetical protein